MTTSNKPTVTIAIDFDGTIHSYEGGWRDGSIYGQVIPGFKEWLEEIGEVFRVVVHTSRGTKAVEQWLELRGIDLPVVNEKPPAWVTIDDRAIRFDGNWRDAQLALPALLAFRPWNHKHPEEGD